MTTQEATTGGLPGATGGALPADRDLPGVSVPPGLAEPLQGFLASLPSAVPADPREDPLWTTIREYLPSLAPYTLDGLVTRIRRTLA